MNLILSTRDRAALLEEGGCFSLIDTDHPDVLSRCTVAEATKWLSRQSSLEFRKNLTLDEIRSIVLELACEDDALDFCLYLLDPELSVETRTLAARELERLYRTGLAGIVQDLLYSAPLPDHTDIEVPLRIASEIGLTLVHKFILELKLSQKVIANVRTLWMEAISASPEMGQAAESYSLRKGLFRKYVQGILYEKSLVEIKSDSLSGLSEANLLKASPIFEEWFKLLVGNDQDIARERVREKLTADGTAMVQVFKILADETRLKILLYMIREGEFSVSALCKRLGQSQPAISHHLALLRIADMVEVRREGKDSIYSTKKEEFHRIMSDLFSEMLSGGNTHFLGELTGVQSSTAAGIIGALGRTAIVPLLPVVDE